MIRLLTNILVDDLSKSKAFYVDLFGMTIQFEADWFALLACG